MAAVRIPPTLRAEVGGARELEAQGTTVAEVIDDLVERFPPLAAQLLQDGELAPFVNVYVGGEDVRMGEGLDTAVREGDQLILLPAMAGGC
jgi:molybdopterin synthase sulfur carrier subunit